MMEQLVNEGWSVAHSLATMIAGGCATIFAVLWIRTDKLDNRVRTLRETTFPLEDAKELQKQVTQLERSAITKEDLAEFKKDIQLVVEGAVLKAMAQAHAREKL